MLKLLKLDQIGFQLSVRKWLTTKKIVGVQTGIINETRGGSQPAETLAIFLHNRCIID